MQLLIVTWDGAGNLPPLLALIRTLTDVGHEVHVLCHNVQRRQVEAAGGLFAGFATAQQWDVGVPGYLGDGPIGTLMAFDAAAGADCVAFAERLGPAAVLIDCMLPATLTRARDGHWHTVALVHALYSFFIDFAGGLFREPIDKADLALGMSYRALDSEVELPDNFRFVGPPRPDLGAAPWPRRLPGLPFAVASLSTGVQSPEQQGLLQRLCDALAGLDVEALVTTGRGIAPESLTAGGNTTLERLVPHEASLRNADLFITHAGHGSVTAGLRFGVPMPCLPPFADQPVNAAKVARLGLGEVLDPTSSVAQIREAVVRLLGDASLQARAKAFAERLAGEPGLETAVSLIEALGSSDAQPVRREV